MFNLHLDPTEVHQRVWNSVFLDTPYGGFLTTDPGLRGEITLKLLRSVIGEIFFSVPEEELEEYECVLCDYVSDHLGLHRALAKFGEIEPPLEAAGFAHVTTNSDPFGLPKMSFYHTLESRKYLCLIAYGEVRDKFRDYIEGTIRHAFMTEGVKFNPYLEVEINPRFHRNRRIVSLELRFGKDVRIEYYNQQFPSGRFSNRRPSTDSRKESGEC